MHEILCDVPRRRFFLFLFRWRSSKHQMCIFLCFDNQRPPSTATHEEHTDTHTHIHAHTPGTEGSHQTDGLRGLPRLTGLTRAFNSHPRMEKRGCFNFRFRPQICIENGTDRLGGFPPLSPIPKLKRYIAPCC